VLHVFESTAPRTEGTEVPLTPCTRVVPQLTGAVLLNRGHMIMQSIIDIAMPRKWLGEGVE
jgi:hypothetical protein